MSDRMSIHDAARLLGVSYQWCYRLAKRRGLGTQVDGRRMLTAEEVETIRATRRRVGRPASSQQSEESSAESAKVAEPTQPMVV